MFAIKKMRERAGLTQQEAADALGIAIRRYGNWERETRQINLLDAMDLAELFGCTLDELAGLPPKVVRYQDARQGELNQIWTGLSEEGKGHVLYDARSVAALERGEPEGAHASQGRAS